jgi:signal transduction histidine kinase
MLKRGYMLNKDNVRKVFFGSIRRKILFSFLLVVFIVFIFGLIGVFYQESLMKKKINNNLDNDLIIIENFFYSSINQESVMMSTNLNILVQDKEIKESFSMKSKENLIDKSVLLFLSLKEFYGLTHFNYILLDGSVYLRVHDKDRFGDYPNWTSFLKAKENLEESFSIELGLNGYALRNTMPYYLDNNLIGYIQFGKDINSIINTLKLNTGNNLILIQNESIIYSTLNDNIEKTYFKDFSLDNILNGYYYIDNNHYGLRHFNVDNNLVEDNFRIIILTDINYELFLIKRTKIIFITFIVLLMVMTFIVGFFISDNISRPITELYLATKRIENRNFCCVDLKNRDSDELEELGKSFNHMTEALSRIDDERKQIDIAKTDFLSITSHELRSPITPMKAQLQMLQEKYFGVLNKKQKDSIDIILRNTNRLDSIIQDILEVSRIETARLRFNYVRTDLKKETKDMIKLMKGFMSEKKIRIMSRISNIPIIETDPERIMQVLRNLINNAIKFSPVNAKIIISLDKEKNFILFSVSDEGCGIDEKHKDKVFSPFFQEEHALSRNYEGVGLGLAICKGIIEMQGGKIWFENNKIKGITFYFTVPITPIKNMKPIKLVFAKDIKEPGEKRQS